MRKFAAFWTRMRRKRREQRNKVPVDAIDEMRLKSAEALVMCKKPTRGADDKQRGRTMRWKRDVSSHLRDKFVVHCHCHRVICDFT